MPEIADIILRSGKSGVELSLFVLLPVMVVMLSIMRLLESFGILKWVTKIISPILHPFGLPGLGVFALIQIMFVSFTAPIATLAIMDKGGTPRRYIAATLAMVLGMAQANVTFPMVAIGLNGLFTILISVICAIFGAALTYYLFAKNLSPREDENKIEINHSEIKDTTGFFDIIYKAGAESFKISVGAMPLIIMALFFVNLLNDTGVIGIFVNLFSPIFFYLNLPEIMLVPIITKYIAGGTAMMGVITELIKDGSLTANDLNRMAGFLIHPLDIAGVAVLISAGKRVAEVLKPALFGAICAITLRTYFHFLFEAILNNT